VCERIQLLIGRDDLPFVAARWASVTNGLVAVTGRYRERYAALRLTCGTLGSPAFFECESRHVATRGRRWW